MNNVVIVGCGKIAGFWEELSSKHVYGHALAYTNHSGFQIVGCVDENADIATKFAGKYGVENYSIDCLVLLEKMKPDVVSICTPDSTHYQIAKSILENGPSSIKLLFMEKPVCGSISELTDLKLLAETVDVAVVVNHSRRFHSVYRELKKKYSASEFGALVRADFYYYGGWRHNGIHLVDTLSYLLSSSLSDIEVMETWPSRHEGDATFSVRAKMTDNGAPIWFHGFDEAYYQLFDLDFKFEKGRLRLVNFESDIIWDEVRINAMQESELVRGDLGLSQVEYSPMENAIQLISSYLESMDHDLIVDVSLGGIECTMKTILDLRESDCA